MVLVGKIRKEDTMGKYANHNCAINWVGKSFVGSTLCQWQVISLRVKKHIEKGLHEGIYVGPQCTPETSHTHKVELWKIHPSQDMATVTSNTVQIPILMFKGTSILPPCHVWLCRSTQKISSLSTSLARLGPAYKGPHPNQWKKTGARVIPVVPRIFFLTQEYANPQQLDLK